MCLELEVVLVKGLDDSKERPPVLGLAICREPCTPVRSASPILVKVAAKAAAGLVVMAAWPASSSMAAAQSAGLGGGAGPTCWPS
jgi:hypothetical protein